MKTKNLLILAAVVLAVAAYVFLFERHQPTSEEARKDSQKVLHGFDRDQVTGVLLDRVGGRVHLEKKGEAWRLTEPIDFPADSSTVSSMLGSLANLEADRQLPLTEVNAADYGLIEPAATITLTMEDGSDVKLAVGNEMPLGSKRALRVGDADEIDIAPGWFMTDVERGLDDWRSRDVFDLRADQVASIDIRAGADTIRAARVGDQWRLLSPLEDLADRDHLQGLVSDLGALHIEKFLDDDVDPADLGLVTPAYELEIVRSDGGEPIRLDFGATRKGEGGAEIACRRGDSEYFWVADRVSTRLAKAPVLWRSKKVMPFSTWQATGLHLKTPGGDVALEKKGDTSLWRLADGTEADQSRVTDRLTALAGLEATDYDLMAPLTDEMGSAEVALAASGDGGEPSTLSFTFFAPLSEGGRAMVRVTGRETVMGVDPSEVQRIIGDLDDLRSPPKEESDAAAE